MPKSGGCLETKNETSKTGRRLWQRKVDCVTALLFHEQKSGWWVIDAHSIQYSEHDGSVSIGHISI